jgi:hypothetical protein
MTAGLASSSEKSATDDHHCLPTWEDAMARLGQKSHVRMIKASGSAKRAIIAGARPKPTKSAFKKKK